METFPALMALCTGYSPVTGGFPPWKASDAELWCIRSYAPEQTAGQAVEMLEIWDTMVLIATPL